MIIRRAIHAGLAGKRLEPPTWIGEQNSILLVRQRQDSGGERGFSGGAGALFCFGPGAGHNRTCFVRRDGPIGVEG